MPHAIVQTTDARGNAELYIVPEGWIQETSRGKSYHLWPKYKNKRHLQQMVRVGNCTGNPNWEKIKCIVKKKNIGTLEDAEQLVTAMSDENNSDFSITSAPTLDGIERANFENLMVIDDVKNESTEAVEESRWSEYSIEWLHDNDAHDPVESINGSIASLHSTHGNETKVAVEENQSAKYSTEEWLHENDANDKCDTTNDSVTTVCSNHGYQMLENMDDANAQYPHSYIPCDPNNLVKSNHLLIDENNNVPRHTQNQKGDYDHTQQLNEIDNRLSRIEKMQATLITQMNILLDKTCPLVPPHLKEKHANIKTIKTLEDLEKLNKDLESFTNMRTIFDWLDFLISNKKAIID
ncbi:uncharacterized protein LOC121600995 [Anopheles merus]|uniref:uncharacterized protein LOC121600995 n=1 Tax=Anopheles merus TaxID=30066 RepID=UPI001BE43979|nr:uncharacterized protein LOC121600995 [Anopheles merus]XP_041785712.1 uncharacterized protein LOC121600995 [Anopheles merus]XP_041785713.1 uncharacterized protein LOC121600995 [Anopheles merus]